MEERRIIFIFVILTILNQESAGSPLQTSDKDGNDQIKIKTNVTNKNQSCGGDLAATDAVQHFYSHAGYGEESYEPGASCEWRIVAPAGHKVRLTFLTFELESQKDCLYDFVQVQEGLEGGDEYGKYCGSEVPPEIVSTSRALTVRFRTDHSLVYKGFAASYQAV